MDAGRPRPFVAPLTVRRNPWALSRSTRSAAVDRATWKTLTLHAQETWPDGTVDDTYVVTLQPPERVEATGATVGAEVPIPLDLVEMGTRADLTARVVAIGPCPPIAAGPGRVVLTTVSHLNRFLFDLSFVSPTGEVDSVRTTGPLLLM